MNSSRRTLARVLIASLLIVCLWLPQLRDIAPYQDYSVQTDGFQNVPSHGNTTKHRHDAHRTNTSQRKIESSTTATAFRLLPTDSLYHHYNMSTTPIVLESHKLLLFTIEKVGSTVLRQLMRRMMGHDDYDFHGGGIPHVFPKNGLRYLHQYSLEEAREMLVSDEWVRAMFVRDPKERALSGIFDVETAAGGGGTIGVGSEGGNDRIHDWEEG
eukprot:CCRYP_015381-RA/>CCRYP_015381-RA protein AED:0.03 eAED:0.03 QI:83/1/1/1/1/1/2/889/212